jgi:hypothetical protein
MYRLPYIQVIVDVHDHPVALVRLDQRARELIVHGVYLVGVTIGSRSGRGDIEGIFTGGLS